MPPHNPPPTGQHGARPTTAAAAAAAAASALAAVAAGFAACCDPCFLRRARRPPPLSSRRCPESRRRHHDGTCLRWPPQRDRGRLPLPRRRQDRGASIIAKPCGFGVRGSPRQIDSSTPPQKTLLKTPQATKDDRPPYAPGPIRWPLLGNMLSALVQYKGIDKFDAAMQGACAGLWD